MNVEKFSIDEMIDFSLNHKQKLKEMCDALESGTRERCIILADMMRECGEDVEQPHDRVCSSWGSVVKKWENDLLWRFQNMKASSVPTQAMLDEMCKLYYRAIDLISSKNRIKCIIEGKEYGYSDPMGR
jgi:methanogenic corrinoid protein MtbC1